MGRQVGAVLGVATLIGILGTPAPGHAVAAFRHGWYAVAAASLLAACATVPLVRTPRPSAAEAGEPAEAAGTAETAKVGTA